MIILFFVAMTGVALVWTPHDPMAFNVDARYNPPATSFLLGTDHLGRDVLSRIMRGARFSLYISVLAVASGSVLGALIGLSSGYFAGKVEAVLERLVEIMLAIPPLVLALALVSVRPSSHFPPPLNTPVNDVVLAIAFLMVPRTARVIRSVALTEKTREYIEAARAMGASHWRIIFRHLTPQCVPAYIIIATAELGSAVLIEAALGFLGLGVQAPEPSWGNMISGRSLSDFQKAPWVNILPGVALSFTVFAFNVFGDALRDVLDPRLRR